MSFRLEADLTEPMVAWLEDAGLEVRMEVPILGRRADLIGMGTETLTAVEMKVNDWAEALRQAIAYQLAADRSWVAMPLAGASRAYRQRWHFEVESVGLLAVDDQGGVRTAIPAGPSPRLLPFLRDRILEASRHESAILQAPQLVLPHRAADDYLLYPVRGFAPQVVSFGRNRSGDGGVTGTDNRARRHDGHPHPSISEPGEGDQRRGLSESPG